TGRSDERTGDDASDSEALARQLVRDIARAIQLRNGDDVLVRGDLKYAVGRRVNDQRAGSQVLRAELVDDLRTRCSLVAEYASSGLARERVQEIAGETVRKDWKRALQEDPHH